MQENSAVSRGPYGEGITLPGTMDMLRDPNPVKLETCLYSFAV